MTLIAIGLLLLLFAVQKRRQTEAYERAKQAYAEVLRAEAEAQKAMEEEQKKIEEKKENDSFYQKLADGFAVNILIVGDSIGAGTGAETGDQSWAALLQRELEKQYGVDIAVTNVSMGGNTSYAGYVRTVSLPDDADFDLAILCYGENDVPEGFELYYESIVRAVKNKYPKCALISILESSQRTYTEKMQAIQRIAEHYGYPTVDTIAPFAENYDALTTDGIHPNNEGHKIYFETVLDEIEKGVVEYRGRDPETVVPIDPGVTAFDTYRYISVDEFDRVDDLTYQIPVKITGIVGIDYDPRLGTDKSAELYIDGEMFDTLSYDFGQRHIVMISDQCEVNDTINISFAEKATADGFYGLCFSNMA